MNHACSDGNYPRQSMIVELGNGMVSADPRELLAGQ